MVRSILIPILYIKKVKTWGDSNWLLLINHHVSKSVSVVSFLSNISNMPRVAAAAASCCCCWCRRWHAGRHGSLEHVCPWMASVESISRPRMCTYRHVTVAVYSKWVMHHSNTWRLHCANVWLHQPWHHDRSWWGQRRDTHTAHICDVYTYVEALNLCIDRCHWTVYSFNFYRICVYRIQEDPAYREHANLIILTPRTIISMPWHMQASNLARFTQVTRRNFELPASLELN